MKTEPAVLIGMVTSIITTVLAYLVSEGVIDDGLSELILGAATGVLPLIVALLVRANVYAPATVEDEIEKAKQQALEGVVWGVDAAQVAPESPAFGVENDNGEDVIA